MLSRRGRPKGSTGSAAVLTDGDIRRVFRVARSRDHFPERAEAVLALSLGLGLRAGEIARLTYSDAIDEDGRVRMFVRVAHRSKDLSDIRLSSTAREVLVRYADRTFFGVPQPPDAPLFPSQKRGSLTAGSMSRYLKGLYLEAGVVGGSAQSGRRTLTARLADRQIDLLSPIDRSRTKPRRQSQRVFLPD